MDRIRYILPFLVLSASLLSCGRQKEHTAPPVNERDSVSMMTSYGVNTLISDSGVIKYRIVTERWEVNTVRNPSRWIFEKGIFFEQFDEKYQVQSYIQCDTAYYYDQKKLWELRGRVRVLTGDGVRFASERLYWDENRHELYSDVHSRLVTPQRTIEGCRFRSDERMTDYEVYNSSGSFEKDGMLSGDNAADTSAIPQDTLPDRHVRPQHRPVRNNK